MYNEIIKTAHTQSSKDFLSLATKLGLDTDFFISVCDIPIAIEENTSTALIINSPISMQEKAGALLISQMGEGMLKWYMLSAYQITYQDKFAETFKDDYNALSRCFAELYENKPLALNEIEQIVYKRKEAFDQVFPIKKQV